MDYICLGFPTIFGRLSSCYHNVVMLPEVPDERGGLQRIPRVSTSSAAKVSETNICNYLTQYYGKLAILSTENISIEVHIIYYLYVCGPCMGLKYMCSFSM